MNSLVSVMRLALLGHSPTVRFCVKLFDLRTPESALVDVLNAEVISPKYTPICRVMVLVMTYKTLQDLGPSERLYSLIEPLPEL